MSLPRTDLRCPEIVELLDRINENGTTIIMVTHEHELVKQFDHRIVVIDNGEVVSDMANGGVLHYDSKTGYQPVPNVTEMKTITLHNVNVSYENSPVTQIIETEVPVRPSSSNVPDIRYAGDERPDRGSGAEGSGMSFTEATPGNRSGNGPTKSEGVRAQKRRKQSASSTKLTRTRRRSFNVGYLTKEGVRTSVQLTCRRLRRGPDVLPAPHRCRFSAVRTSTWR